MCFPYFFFLFCYVLSFFVIDFIKGKSELKQIESSNQGVLPGNTSIKFSKSSDNIKFLSLIFLNV